MYPNSSCSPYHDLSAALANFGCTTVDKCIGNLNINGAFNIYAKHSSEGLMQRGNPSDIKYLRPCNFKLGVKAYKETHYCHLLSLSLLNCDINAKRQQII